jgi:aspartate/methionine/tyrosine aminotransferase
MMCSGVLVMYGIMPAMTEPSNTDRRVSALLAGLAPSATLAVDARAKALKAAGQPVIGFGAGEPDFPTPPAIVEAAAAACLDPAMHKYTPTAGLPALRQAVAAKTERDSGFVVDHDQVLVTNGGKHAVYTALVALLDPGDEVLIPAPFWTTYPEAVRLVGGVPVTVPTTAEHGFCATVEDLEAARTPRTKVLVFNSPSNPTGAVYPPSLVAEIGRWAAANDVWVLADEIYEHLVYGDATHVSMPVVAPEIADRTLIVNGVAKTYAMTGWRVGWLLGPHDVIDAAINFQSQVTSNISNISQRAALAAVQGDLTAVESMRGAFDRRRQTMVAMLNAIDGVECLLPDGAFYCFPDVSGLLGRARSGSTSATSSELAEALLDIAKIAVVPGEAFGAPGYFRLSCALSDADLEEGLTRFQQFAAEA